MNASKQAELKINSYLPQLDGLRALAVFAVMSEHFMPLQHIYTHDFLSPGHLGVRLFFVLSGFLITGILLDGRRNVSPFFTAKQFYIRRFLRIFPIYYLTLFIVTVLDVKSARETFFWHLGYLSNLYFSLKGRFTGPTGHFWSLAVEEQFYIVWPWLMLFLPYRHLRKSFVFVIIMAVGFKLAVYSLDADALAGDMLPFGCMESLGLGGLLAYVIKDERFSFRTGALLKAVLLLGTLMLVCMIMLAALGWATLAQKTFQDLSISLLFVGLIGRAAIGFQGITKKALEWRPIVALGRISYGMYLYHVFMQVLVLKVCGTLHIGLGYRPYLIIAPVASFLTVIVATISWFMVEKPINQMKHRFAYKRE
jgi:peptidoglycan/LPS O-acetylase OafA/YrhL